MDYKQIVQIADLSNQLRDARNRKDAFTPANIKKEVLKTLTQEQRQVIVDFENTCKAKIKDPESKAIVNQAKEEMEGLKNELISLLQDAYQNAIASITMPSFNIPFEWLQKDGKKLPVFQVEKQVQITDGEAFIRWAVEHNAYDLVEIDSTKLADWMRLTKSQTLPDGICIETHLQIA